MECPHCGSYLKFDPGSLGDVSLAALLDVQRFGRDMVVIEVPNGTYTHLPIEDYESLALRTHQTKVKFTMKKGN